MRPWLKRKWDEFANPPPSEERRMSLTERSEKRQGEMRAFFERGMSPPEKSEDEKRRLAKLWRDTHKLDSFFDEIIAMEWLSNPANRKIVEDEADAKLEPTRRRAQYIEVTLLSAACLGLVTVASLGFGTGNWQLTELHYRIVIGVVLTAGCYSFSRGAQAGSEFLAATVRVLFGTGFGFLLVSFAGMAMRGAAWLQGKTAVPGEISWKWWVASGIFFGVNSIESAIDRRGAAFSDSRKAAATVLSGANIGFLVFLFLWPGPPPAAAKIDAFAISAVSFAIVYGCIPVVVLELVIDAIKRCGSWVRGRARFGGPFEAAREFSAAVSSAGRLVRGLAWLAAAGVMGGVGSWWWSNFASPGTVFEVVGYVVYAGAVLAAGKGLRDLLTGSLVRRKSPGDVKVRGAVGTAMQDETKAAASGTSEEPP